MQKATEVVTYKKETCKSLIVQVFQLYSNLLTEEAWRPWRKILGKQMDGTPWADIFGVKYTEEQKKSWLPFMDYITFH